MLKQFPSTILCLVILFTMALSGCGGTKSSENTLSTSVQSDQSTAAEHKDGYSLPLSTSGETLVIGTVENPGDKTIASGLPVFQEIEKKTGVKIKWEATVATNYNTVMQTRLSAGQNLPDIIVLPGDPIKYAEDGVIIEIGGLIQKFAPNIAKWFDKEATVRKVMTALDGKIYTLPGVITEEDGAANDKYNILAQNVREDWLNKLDLQVPTTLDEFYTMLVAFKTGDPNGNGKADEIPYTTWFADNIYGQIGYSFGLHLLMNGGYYPDKSGKIVCEWMTPKAKEMLTLLNKWYTEGLLDPGMLKADFEKWNSQISNGLVGALPLSTIYAAYAVNGPMQETTKDPNAKFIPIEPIKGPDGTQITECSLSAAQAGSSSGLFAITKSCRNPELAIKWLDYASFSDEGIMYNEWGIEEISYTMQNGEPSFTDKILKSKDGITSEMYRVGGYHSSFPQILTTKGRYAAFLPAKDLFPIAEKIYSIAKDHPLLPVVMTTKDESDIIASVKPDIDTYIKETTTKFITGQIPLSNFDKFAEKLKDMKIDELLKIKQAQYDRFNNN